MVLFIFGSLAYAEREYHWKGEESIGFKQVGGIETPGLIEVYKHGLFMR